MQQDHTSGLAVCEHLQHPVFGIRIACAWSQPTEGVADHVSLPETHNLVTDQLKMQSAGV